MEIDTVISQEISQCPRSHSTACFSVEMMISFEGFEDAAPCKSDGYLKHLGLRLPPPARFPVLSLSTTSCHQCLHHPDRHLLPLQKLRRMPRPQRLHQLPLISLFDYISLIQESLHKPSPSDGFALSNMDSDFIASLLEREIPELENLQHFLTNFSWKYNV